MEICGKFTEIQRKKPIKIIQIIQISFLTRIITNWPQIIVNCFSKK